MKLSPLETRVLGALMEKAITTPEYYPLTLNSLTLACNQKTSRDPITSYDDDEVLYGLDQLRDKGVVLRVDVSGSRVPKFRHSLTDKWDLDSPSYALLCVLFLRGAQTLGQLRQRTDRLYAFDSLGEVESTLESMADREDEPHILVQRLPRSPGTKEIRYRHAFADLPDPAETTEDQHETVSTAPGSSPISALEGRIVELESRLEQLSQQFDEFRKQFD